MNRADRRKLQKAHKYVYSADEFNGLTVQKQIRLVKRLTKTIIKTMENTNGKDNN